MKTEKMTARTCEYCDGNVRRRLTQTPFHYRSHVIYVDRVPAWVCDACGEHYFDAPVYKRLEQIARNRRRIQKTIRFPLAVYDKAPA